MTKLVTELVVSAADAGLRLDQFLAQSLGVSRGRARRLIEQGCIRIGRRHGKKGDRVEAGERIDVDAQAATEEALRPLPSPEAPLEVIAQAPAWVALSKPAGSPSHPLHANETGTAANALVARFPECATASEDPREGGLVHRLDTDTTGVLLAARTRDAWQRLRQCFADQRVTKTYLALVHGTPHGPSGCVSVPLRSAGRRSVVDAGGLPAETQWTVLSHFPSAAARTGDLTLLRLEMKTGRMHQIRSHMSYLGLPLLGDVLYGGSQYPGLDGHFLHAERLAIATPDPDLPTHLEAPLPTERKLLLDALEQAASMRPN